MQYSDLTPEKLYLALNFLAIWNNTEPGSRFLVIKPKGSPQYPVIEKRQAKTLITFNPKTHKEVLEKAVKIAQEIIVAKL